MEHARHRVYSKSRVLPAQERIVVFSNIVNFLYGMMALCCTRCRWCKLLTLQSKFYATSVREEESFTVWAQRHLAADLSPLLWSHICQKAQETPCTHAQGTTVSALARPGSNNASRQLCNPQRVLAHHCTVCKSFMTEQADVIASFNECARFASLGCKHGFFADAIEITICLLPLKVSIMQAAIMRCQL